MLYNLSVSTNPVQLRYMVKVAVSWLCGLALGVCLYLSVADSLLRAFSVLSLERGSLWNLIASLFAPFLLAALFSKLRTQCILHLFLLFKATIFGFASCAMTGIFENAGWLARTIIMFSSTAATTVMLYYILSFAIIDNRRSYRFGACLILIAFIVCIDYYKISPFVMALFPQ